MIHVLFLSQYYIDSGSPINHCRLFNVFISAVSQQQFCFFCIKMQLPAVLVCSPPVFSYPPCMNFRKNVYRQVNGANPTSLGMQMYFLWRSARSSLSHRVWPAGSLPQSSLRHCCQRCGCRKSCVLLQNLFMSLPSPRQRANKCCFFGGHLQSHCLLISLIVWSLPCTRLRNKLSRKTTLMGMFIRCLKDYICPLIFDVSLYIQASPSDLQESNDDHFSGADERLGSFGICQPDGWTVCKEIHNWCNKPLIDR